ncbi:hypothetical protein BDY24DRAFT_437876 [Mrakia frigida]|uniref:Zn(II)2Cys6 transcription factor domain-containing protein n=1 Tax=Mrakia frigida TaxID=29902 RepID=UPI003FCC186F
MSPTAADVSEAPRGHQRVGMACTYCRRRKIRCNGQEPCSTCVRTKRTDCIYAAVDPKASTTVKERRQASYPQQTSSSAGGRGRGGAVRGVGAARQRKAAGGRKKKASKGSDDDDDFYGGEPLREVGPGRVILSVGSIPSRRPTRNEQSSSGHSSTSSPPVTPRSASEAEWDRSPLHPHSDLHSSSKAHYTHPPITQSSNYSYSSSPSSYASSPNPALSARSSPNVGPGGSLPSWVPSWTPSATSPFFPSVLLGSGYTYDDDAKLDREQRTILPGASPSKSSPLQALHDLPTSQQKQQHREQQQQRLQGLPFPSSSSGSGTQSVLGFNTNNNKSLEQQIPLYPYPNSSPSSSSNLNQSTLLAPSAITPDLYQSPLPESEYGVAFDHIHAYPSSFMIANQPSFIHHRSNSSHSTTSTFSDSYSSLDGNGNGQYQLPGSSSSAQRSYSSTVPRRSSNLSDHSQYSLKHRAQTDGATPHNSSLLADHLALFEGLDGTYASDDDSFALDLSIGEEGDHHDGDGFLDAGITGWTGGDYTF